MSFLELLKKKTEKAFEATEKAAIEDWRTTVPEGYDFEARVEIPKLQCPRCEKMIPESDFRSHKDSHSSEIIENFLYLGGERNAYNFKELKERTHIGVIVTVSFESMAKFPDDFQYRHYPLSDDAEQDILSFFEKVFDDIEEAKNRGDRVLVHCIQGISRSASIVISYLMKANKWTLKQSYEYTKSKRDVIKPNVNFLKQLGRYEVQLFGGEPSLKPEDVFPPETSFLC